MFISKEQMRDMISSAINGSKKAISHVEAIAALRKENCARDNMFINMARLAMEKI